MKIKKLLMILEMLLINQLLIINCLAEPNIEVTGIITGGEFMAVVNGKLVKKGDEIEGYKIEEIASDFVKLNTGDGNYLVKHLSQTERKNKTIDGKNGLEKVRTSSVNTQSVVSTQNYEEARIDALKAEQLLETRTMSINLYEQALTLYAEAKEKLVADLNQNSNGLYVSRVNFVTQRTEEIAQRKWELYVKIRDGQKNGTLIPGMSKEDVIQMEGRPDKVNQDNYGGSNQEQWVYGNSLYLYFDGDVLTSYQDSRSLTNDYSSRGVHSTMRYKGYMGESESR